MTNLDAILSDAMKLLAKRDYSIAGLRQKLSLKHGGVPEEVIQYLVAKRFLDDRRFAESYVSRRKDRGMPRLRRELDAQGVARELVEEILGRGEWPSLHEALTARMVDGNCVLRSILVRPLVFFVRSLVLDMRRTRYEGK